MFLTRIRSLVPNPWPNFRARASCWRGVSRTAPIVLARSAGRAASSPPPVRQHPVQPAKATIPHRRAAPPVCSMSYRLEFAGALSAGLWLLDAGPGDGFPSRLCQDADDRKNHGAVASSPLPPRLRKSVTGDPCRPSSGPGGHGDGTGGWHCGDGDRSGAELGWQLHTRQARPRFRQRMNKTGPLGGCSQRYRLSRY